MNILNILLGSFPVLIPIGSNNYSGPIEPLIGVGIVINALAIILSLYRLPWYIKRGRDYYIKNKYLGTIDGKFFLEYFSGSFVGTLIIMMAIGIDAISLLIYLGIKVGEFL